MKDKIKNNSFIKYFFLLTLAVSVFTYIVFMPKPVFAASSQIRITEIMYDPSGNGDREFLEVYNGSDTTVNLGGMTFFGVDYTFPGGTTLGSGQYGVVVRNLAVFQANNPGVRIFGQYGGKLRGSGEVVSVSKNGVAQTKVSYSYGGAWPSTPKDGGPSLSLVRTNANEAQAACWAASVTSGGTPGSANNPAGGGGGGCGTVMYPVVASSNTNENNSQSSVSGQPTSNSDQGSSSIQSHEGGDGPEELTEEEKLQEQAKQEAAVAEEASKQIAEDSATRRNQTRTNIIVALLLISVTVGGSSVYLLYHHTRFRVEQSKLLKGSKKHHAKHEQKS